MTNPRVPFQLSSARPRLAPPEGKPLIVHVVVNVESWPFDAPMPRKLLTAPHGLEVVPDIPNWSWAEYGLRAGMPRLFKMFADKSIPASAFINAGIIEDYPDVAAAIKGADWEVVGHGFKQRSLQGEDDEAAVIERCLVAIEAYYGARPRGWLGPGLKESLDTPDILKAAGIDYVCDWVLDDLPCWMDTKHGPLLNIPYTLEHSDVLVYSVEKLDGADVLRRLEATLETFDRELDDQPRVLTVPIHPHIIGVPHRFPFLMRMLDLLLARDDVLFTTADGIADWYRAEDSR